MAASALKNRPGVVAALVVAVTVLPLAFLAADPKAAGPVEQALGGSSEAAAGAGNGKGAAVDGVQSAGNSAAEHAKNAEKQAAKAPEVTQTATTAVEESTPPAEQASAPASEPAPRVENAAPAVEKTAPAVPAKNAEANGENTVAAVEQQADPAQAVVEQQTARATSVLEQPAAAVEPVAEQARPVTEQAAAAVEPVAEQARPVTEQAAAAVEPVAEQTAPVGRVVAAAEPVAALADRAVRPATRPVQEAVTEMPLRTERARGRQSSSSSRPADAVPAPAGSHFRDRAAGHVPASADSTDTAVQASDAGLRAAGERAGATSRPEALSASRIDAASDSGQARIRPFASLLAPIDSADLMAPTPAETVPATAAAAPATAGDGSAPVITLPGVDHDLGGATASTSLLLFAGAALLVSLLLLQAPGMLRRVLTPAASWRPVPFVALLERPG